MKKTYSFARIRADWEGDKHDLRFGQYFCNKYISQPWPTLFYADYDFAVMLIKNWLVDNQYEWELPPLRKET